MRSDASSWITDIAVTMGRLATFVTSNSARMIVQVNLSSNVLAGRVPITQPVLIARRIWAEAKVYPFNDMECGEVIPGRNPVEEPLVADDLTYSGFGR